jgi:hypothetical protein
MPAKITYYAIVNEFSSRERPSGVIRRIVDDDGRDDQAFTRDLKWEHTGTLYSYERGDGDNKLYEITEDEANRIVERIRRTVADALRASGLGRTIVRWFGSAGPSGQRSRHFPVVPHARSGLAPSSCAL